MTVSKLHNNKNAYIGMNIETLFKNSVVDHLSVIDKIADFYGISSRFISATKSGITGDKSDIRLSYASGHYVEVNIKAYKENTGFNQLTRTTIKRFSEIFCLSDHQSNNLESLIITKSKNPKDKLFPDHLQNQWLEFFKLNAVKLVKWGFSVKPSRELLALYNRDTDKFRLYPMKIVLENIGHEIFFNQNGNVNIGNCILLQRKGGNGSLSKHIPKTNIAHPGNNLQLKLKIKPFITCMESYQLAEYDI